MNKITLLSASAFFCVVCTTCSAPSESMVQQAKAFADMKESNTSSGIKCISHTESISEIANQDSAVVDTHSGIICIED